MWHGNSAGGTARRSTEGASRCSFGDEEEQSSSGSSHSHSQVGVGQAAQVGCARGVGFLREEGEQRGGGDLDAGTRSSLSRRGHARQLLLLQRGVVEALCNATVQAAAGGGDVLPNSVG